jgi:DNA modification methylase
MILNCDALEYMRIMPPEWADVIITDPPYRTISGGEGGADGRPSGMLTKNDGRIFEHNDVTPSEWMPLLYRSLKSPGHCYVMTNLVNLWDMQQLAVSSGFKVHNLLVWVKNTVNPNRWYMKNVEYILFLRKGPARAINTPSLKMTLHHDNLTGPNRDHPTMKPIGLMQDMILASSVPGDLVFDPFAGTGSTGVAALQSGRRFVGCEIDKEYHAQAVLKNDAAGAAREG